MILADKIMKLRKESGMSQEELAERLNVSRQAVSKWECSETIPDLQKIIQLSELFSVSTDYLLKDEIISIDRNAMNKEAITDSNDVSEGQDGKRKLTIAEANDYIEYKEKSSLLTGLATFLCVISPITLLVLLGFAGIESATAIIIGLTTLFILVGGGTAIFILNSYRGDVFGYIYKGNYELDYGVDTLIEQRKKSYRNLYVATNIIATILCILSPLPTIITALTAPVYAVVWGVSGTVFVVAIASLMFVFAYVKWDGFATVLNNRGNSVSIEVKKKNKAINDLSSAYWMIASAIYLLVSFLTDAWHITWIIWIVASAGELIISGIYRFTRRR